MGISMSITKNAKYGKPKYAKLGTVNEGAEGAEGAEGDKAEQDKAAEEAAAALEMNSETIDRIKQENFDKWSKIFRDLTRNKEIESKIKSSFKKLFLQPLGQVGGEGEDAPPAEDAPATDAPAADAPAADAPAEGETVDINNFKYFAGLKIVAAKDDVFTYMSGDDKFSLFLKEDIDKYWLVDETIKGLLDEEVALLIIELGKNEKEFKKANEAKYNELSGIVTKITKEIVPKMFDKTQIAIQHKALKDILDYAIESDELKKYHKSQNISDKKESITSGEATAKEVSMEKRDNEAEAKEQKAAEGGPSGGRNVGDSESESDSYSDSESDSEMGSGYSSDGGESYMSSGDNIGGGKIFKSAEEKEYKKFKGEERKDFAEKKDKFMKDDVKVIAFLDANIASLMASYEKNKIGANVKKSSMKTNTALIDALFTAVTTYEKELETTGAAVEMIIKSAEKAAAPAEGEAASGEGEKTDGAAAGDDKKGEAAAGEGEKKDGEAAAPPAAPAGEKKDGAPPPAEKPAVGGASQGGGGHTTTKKPKKKRQPKKLPKNINININLGKTNIAYDNTSSSSSSDSSSSDSSSDSSSSSSDSEEEEEEKVIKKGKKQVKYVVNATKKKNRSKPRREDNDD
jgi:hypothetical protein